MPRPIIKPGGADPVADGDINLYTSPEAKGKAWFDHSRRVVFVNGMDNSPQDHAKSARALSLLQGCPVVGIYNKTDGFWSDLGQCIKDKATLVDMQAQSILTFKQWKALVDALYAKAKATNPSLSKEDYVGGLISGNKATLAVYRYVASFGAGRAASLKIFCHSQGNLVVSNALTGVALALGQNALAGMEVNSFGSPCRFWPSGIRRTNYAFTFDPVSWMDYRIGFDNVKIGFVAAHGFDQYMKYDAEFTVNRFRWGSFGMTASMDEQGLANYCVGLGRNTNRLKPIFDRLKSAHWADCDDVAYLYVKQMRTKHDGLMRQIAKIDKSFIEVLIYCLTGGFFNYTSSGEKIEADYLKGLI